MARQYTGNFSQWGQAGLTTGEETEVPQGTNLFSWSPDLPTPLNQTNPVGTEIPTNQKTYTNDSPQAQGHQFIPTLPRESILHMNDRYRSNPGLFSPDQIDELENHNIHYQIEFHRNLEDEEFKEHCYQLICDKVILKYEKNFGIDDVVVEEEVSE